MAAPNRPKTDQKRSVPAAENGASESGKKKALAELWQGRWAGLGWGWGLAVAWPCLTWTGMAGWVGVCGFGFGWAGLKWAGLAPKAQPSRQGNAAGLAGLGWAEVSFKTGNAAERNI